MDIFVCQKTYNTYGGSLLFSAVGDLLTTRLEDYGSGVESIELIACLPHRRRKFLSTLGELFDQHHKFLKTFPYVAFRRKLKRVEMSFRSEHFFAEDEEDGKPSAKTYSVAAEEVAAALPLLKKRIKPTDDFDVERFLKDASRVLATKIGSLKEWQRIEGQAAEKRQAIQATKSPWELLEIDWSEYHPKARDILDDPFFWEGADDLAPHGNDTGFDLLEDFKDWDKRHRTRSPMLFFDRLLKKWGVEPMDWSITDEATVLKLDKADSISLSLCDEAAIALAFAVLKRRAKCPREIVRMALAALARTAILVNRSRLSTKIKSEWAKAIAKMKGKLESLPKS
ncbi:MAG TPA: hypothetical protein VH592_25105 [Gemmataceae bacterium]